jgi:hypothetical protein
MAFNSEQFPFNSERAFCPIWDATADTYGSVARAYPFQSFKRLEDLSFTHHFYAMAAELDGNPLC